MGLGAVFLVLLVGLLLRMPVAVALLLSSLLYFVTDDTLTAGLAVQRVTAGLNSFPLIAVPLFVLLGQLANETGITTRLYAFAERLFGHLRASHGYVNVSNSFTFSLMSGTAVSDAACMGAIEVKALRDAGYHERFAVGLTAASALVSPIMPPSLPAVVYAVLASVSVGALFLAGVVPALLLVTSLCVVVYAYGRKNPHLVAPRATLREMTMAGVAAAPALLAPVIILGGIFGGIFTPTEAAAVGALYMLLLGVLAYRTMGARRIGSVMTKAVETTGQVMLITGAASAFAFVLSREQAPQRLADALLSWTDNALLFLVLVNIVLLLVGMVLEPISALLVIVPVLLPVALAFGVDPVQFGTIVILNLMIGMLTPPVGLVLFVLSAVTDIPVPRVARAAAPFLIPLTAVLALVTFVPATTLGLASLLG